MGDIRISPAGQLIGALILIAATVAAVASQLPEIRRYLKVRSMD